MYSFAPLCRLMYHGWLTHGSPSLCTTCVVRRNRPPQCTSAHQQERRASARRGSQAAPATATVYRGVIAFLAHNRHQASDGEQGKHSGGVITFPAHVRHSNHGWLTPAAPLRMCRCVCTETLLFRRFVYLPRGADAPRSRLQHDRSPVAKRLPKRQTGSEPTGRTSHAAMGWLSG
jgi:hypothetical protein